MSNLGFTQPYLGLAGTSTIMNIAPIPGQQQQAISQAINFIPLPKQACEQKEVKKGGLVAGPIIAYRSWMLDPSGLLVSYTGTSWEPGAPLRAYCTVGGTVGGFIPQPLSSLTATATNSTIRFTAPFAHSSPQPRCSCGIYAMKDMKDIIGIVGAKILYGEVALWGKVFEHQFGYRAEFAYPYRLYRTTPTSHNQTPIMARFPLPKSDWIQTVANFYGIELAEQPAISQP